MPKPDQIEKCDFSQGNSRLYGENVGDFPKHHFHATTFLDQDCPAPINVTFAGPDENARGWWRERINSDTFSLEWVRSGEMLYTQNGRRYHCHPGELFIIHRHANTRMELATDFSEKWTIAADGKALPAILNALDLTHLDVIQVGENHYVEQLFLDIFNQTRQSSPQHGAPCSILLYKLLLELSQCQRTAAIPSELSAALNVIEHHLEEKLTIAILAQKQCVSPGKLHEMFQRNLGLTPTQFIIGKRMEKARGMLRETTLSVKEIANACGYRDSLYFSTAFKRMAGQSPTDFRNHPT